MPFYLLFLVHRVTIPHARFIQSAGRAWLERTEFGAYLPSFTLTYKRLFIAAMIYCGLPLVIFVLLWVKLAIAIPAALALAASFVLSTMGRKGVKEGGDLFESPFERCTRAFRLKGPQRSIRIPLGWMLAASLVAIAWCIFGGQGGMWYQSGDWDSRNALFRDLITHSWPVHYDSDGALLCYYVAHWLPAAIVGKVVKRLGFSMAVIWKASNLALLLWTALGILLVFLLVLVTIRPKTNRGVAACLFLPPLFATPDLIGILATGRSPIVPENLHIEWWAENMQFSSLTTCLFWVFNQAIIPWICTLLFLNERTPMRYFLIWAACLLAGPLPSIGLAFLMLVQGTLALAESKDQRSTLLKSAASPANILALPAIALTAVYFLSSTATSGELAGSWSEANMLPAPLYLPSDAEALMLAISFIIVEALLLPLLLRLSGIRGPLLISVCIILVICPLVRFNSSADFCMRVSVPAVLVLCALCLQVLLSMLERGEPPRKAELAGVTPIARIALVAVLLLGAFTPLLEFYRGFDSVAGKGIEDSINDPFVTFENRSGWPRTNFTVQIGEDGKQPLFELIAQ